MSQQQQCQTVMLDAAQGSDGAPAAGNADNQSAVHPRSPLPSEVLISCQGLEGLLFLAPTAPGNVRLNWQVRPARVAPAWSMAVHAACTPAARLR